MAEDPAAQGWTARRGVRGLQACQEQRLELPPPLPALVIPGWGLEEEVALLLRPLGSDRACSLGPKPARCQ